MTEECAKAVGVDSDYLSRVEEQKRKREEMVRKKEQRRFGGGEEEEKKKAYLCINIKNMTHLPSAPVRIEKLASGIGEVTVTTE